MTRIQGPSLIQTPAVEGAEAAQPARSPEPLTPFPAVFRAGAKPGPTPDAPAQMHRVNLETPPSVLLSGRVVTPFNLEEDVLWVQRSLGLIDERGHPVVDEEGTPVVDGIEPGVVNEVMLAAIRTFQRDTLGLSGRNASGVISPDRSTNRALAQASDEPRVLTAPIRPPEEGAFNAPRDIAQVQNALVAHNFLSEEQFEPGVMNEATAAAILDFQSQFMAVPDGEISPGLGTNRFLETPRDRWPDLVEERFGDDQGYLLFVPRPLSEVDGSVIDALREVAADSTHSMMPGASTEEQLVRMLTYASIESSIDPSENTGGYVGLFQISPGQFEQYTGGDGEILDAGDNARVAEAILAEKADRFAEDFNGRRPTTEELYILHQQGEIGFRLHTARPDEPAWINMNMAGMLEERTPEERGPLLDTWVAEGRIDAELARQLQRLPQFQSPNPLATADGLDSGWGLRAIGGNLTIFQRRELDFPTNDEITGAEMLEVWSEAVRRREAFYRNAIMGEDL